MDGTRPWSEASYIYIYRVHSRVYSGLAEFNRGGIVGPTF